VQYCKNKAAGPGIEDELQRHAIYLYSDILDTACSVKGMASLARTCSQVIITGNKEASNKIMVMEILAITTPPYLSLYIRTAFFTMFGVKRQSER
jgi:hypothetical protein